MGERPRLQVSIMRDGVNYTVGFGFVCGDASMGFPLVAQHVISNKYEVIVETVTTEEVLRNLVELGQWAAIALEEEADKVVGEEPLMPGPGSHSIPF